MSKKLELYVTTVVVEVLSTYPYSCDGCISQLARDTFGGDCSGIIRSETSKSVDKKKFIELCDEHGSDPSFFGEEFEEEDT